MIKGFLVKHVYRIRSKYVREVDYTFSDYSLRGIAFSNDWCSIKDGDMTIFKGYAWDGCSYKYSVFGFEIGVPDQLWFRSGVSIEDAALPHDVFYQFRDSIPIQKATADNIFLEHLIRRSWPLSKLYHKAVQLFGSRNGWKTK